MASTSSDFVFWKGVKTFDGVDVEYGGGCWLLVRRIGAEAEQGRRSRNPAEAEECGGGGESGGYKSRDQEIRSESN